MKRATMWVGHYYRWFILAAVATYIPLALLDAAPLVRWLALATAIAVDVAQGYHDRRLCLRCMDAQPWTAPQEAVDRRRRELRAYHYFRGRLWLAAVLALGAPVFLPSSWGAWTDLLSRVTVSVLLLWQVYLTFATTIHRRLAPWCPFCDHGHGDDDHDEDDDPDPDDVGIEPPTRDEAPAHQR